MYNAICLLSIYNIMLTHKVFISLLGKSKCELMLVQCSECLDDEFIFIYMCVCVLKYLCKNNNELYNNEYVLLIF